MENIKDNQKQKVALYIRVSTDEQADKYGVDLQKSALIALIKSRPENFELAEKHIYIDEGVSGTVKIDERPAFSQLKEDIIFAPQNEKPFDFVAVYKIDRFARQLKILLDVIELFDDYGVKFVSANESIDTSTPFGKAMLGIIGVIAELERDTILKRTKDGWWEAFEQGTVLGSAAPYGYIKDLNKKYKLFEEEASKVREMFNMFVYEDKSIDAIAQYLHEHKVLSPAASAILNNKRKGKANKKNDDYFWAAGTVRRLLADEVYIGKVYGNKSKKGKRTEKDERILSRTAAPSVIDILTFEKAQILLAQSKHRKEVAKDGHSYLLSGLLKCNCCYDPKTDGLEGKIGWHGERKPLGKNKIQYYYKCGRKNRSKSSTICTSIPLPADEIETYVINYSRNLLQNPVAVFEFQKKLQSRLSGLKHLQKQEASLVDLINALPLRRKRVLRQNQDGQISSSELRESLKLIDEDNLRFKQERAEIQGQLAQYRISKGYIEALELFSQKYTNALKDAYADRAKIYTILHELIEEIVVYTRPKTSTDRVAGMKKDNQQIPNLIHIKLKLPQELISQLGNQQVLETEYIQPISDQSSGQKNMTSAA